MGLFENKDYDALISENDALIAIYEKQQVALGDCFKKICEYLNCIEEDYPNCVKFYYYGSLPSFWKGTYKDNFADNIFAAYDTNINSFKNCIVQILDIVTDNMLSLNKKIEDLKYENFVNFFLQNI